MKTLEQKRAADALEKVKSLEGAPEEFKKCYRSYVDRLGPTIVMNGLGQALATELAAAGGSQSDDARAHKQLYENLHRWLCRGDGVYPGDSDLLTSITRYEEKRYLLAQAEALAWLVWHKKFCRAYLPRGEEE